MDDHTTSWGIEPVPERLRVLGLVDQALLWGSLGVSLLVIVVGALLVPALSLRDALLAILLGGLIGNAMLASAGVIGADARVPGMVLMRAPLGRVGSYAPTVLNTLQCWGWATFELIIIAAAAAALSDELIGVGAQWFWTLVFGAIAAALALMGPVSVVRRFIRRYAVYVVLASLAYLTWWSLVRGRPLASSGTRSRRGRADALDRDGPRDRDHRLVGAADPRLHALLARPARGVVGRRARLLRRGDLDARARRAARPDARALGSRRAAGGGRRRGPGGRACRARDHRRRGRRGVRQHLLERRSRSRTSSPACRSARSSRSSRSPRRSARSPSTCAATRTSSSCSARSSSRCSASCSRTGC